MTPRRSTRPKGSPWSSSPEKNTGPGSSRDWAAKGTALLGAKAVIAKSFERIHRSNLIGMGVLPLQFLDGEGAEELGLSGREVITIEGLDGLALGDPMPEELSVTADGLSFRAKLRIDTPRRPTTSTMAAYSSTSCGNSQLTDGEALESPPMQLGSISATPDPCRTRPKRLPRGRHGLSREAVEADQRIRIITGLAESVRTRGYLDTSVATIIKTAGVSRETFYHLFESKLDCFMGAFDFMAEMLLGHLEKVASAKGEPIERFESALSAYLEALALDPGFARLLLVEVFAAGEDAMERRTRSRPSS